MAGTSSTGIVAAFLGRNSVCVELEEKFVKWSRRNVELLEKSGESRGKVVVVQGDARHLSRIIGEAAKEFGGTDLGGETVVITSPPYADSIRRGGADRSYMVCVDTPTHTSSKYSRNKDNTGNLNYGDIVVITSPPYSECLSKKRGGDTLVKRLEYIRKMPVYTGDENVANLSHGDIDEVVGGVVDGRSRGGDGGAQSGRPLSRGGKGETYLEAMLTIYREMFKILNPGGRAIIIVKPFIRRKRVVDLPYHTWLLMRAAGFSLEKLYKMRIKLQSFWRSLYYSRYVDVPVISHEYVLVCRKPDSGG